MRPKTFSCIKAALQSLSSSASRSFINFFTSPMPNQIVNTNTKNTNPVSSFTESLSPCSLKRKCVDEENFAKQNNGDVIRYVLAHPDAVEPKYGSPYAAGADLYAVEETIVPAKGKALVSTGLKVQIPIGYYGRIAPRSGLASKNFIDTGAGVVDSDYRGVVHVLLFNFGDEDFKVKKHDRIAQFIMEKIGHLRYERFDDIDVSTRGEGGFGSTGV